MRVELRGDDDLRALAFETLFADNPNPVYVLDVDGRFLAGNQALADRTGVPWAQLREMDFGPTVHPDDAARVRAEFEAARRGEVRRYISRGIRPDASVFHAEVVNAPVVRDGKVVALVGIAHDMDAVTGMRTDLDRVENLVRIASRVARLGGWSIDLPGGERVWSPEVDRLLGLPPGSPPTPDEVLSRIHPADRDSLVDAYLRCVSHDEPIDIVVQFEHSDGHALHARIFGEAVHDAGGEVVRVQGAVIDVTEKLRAQRERQQLETRLVTAFDGLSDPMAFVDENWRITYVNDRGIELLGGLPDIVGTELWDLQLPDPEGAQMLREAMRTRRALVHRRFDEGLQRWMEIRAFPAGDLLGVQVRDVTEAEDARRRILDDSRRLHAQTMLLDSTSDAILMRGLDDVVEYANRAATELLDASGAQLVGRALSDVLALDAETARAVEQSIGATGRWEGDLVVRGADGSERIAESRWQMVHDSDGNPDAVFCSLIDVTDRRRQDEVLVRTQRMESIGTLASGIAHDLNNVLTPLLLSTQLLAAGEEDTQRARILAGMQQTVERGADMIRQVLTFARGVEGERAIVSVGGLARGFAEFCRDILPKDIEVEVEADDDLHVLGDPTQLMQVLMNLATNSRDAMPGGGHLRLEATGDADTVTIEVADDGAGMTPDMLARIFEPFYTTKGLGRGTGLGLPVSQAIARTHGGSLEATSTVGAGAVLRLQLPRVEPPADDTDPVADASAAELGGLRVLVVDDEDDIVEIAVLVIADAGGEPVGVDGADAARAELEAAAFDVVLSDLVMPGTTGREFLDWLADRHPRIPVVAMSGVPEQGSNAARRQNVLATLDKPFTADRLREAIRAAAAQGS